MTVDLLSLSWDSHRSILSVFEKLLDSNSLVDCTLTAEGQYLKAHKVILSACSPYFELLFSVENDKHPIIFFKDVKFQELKAVIDFVYRGQVNVPENRLAAFLETAESLQINGIGSPEHSKTEKRGATESLQTCEKEGHSSPVHKKRKKDALDNPQESVEENSKSSKDVNSTISSCHESTFQLPRPSAALLSSTVNAPSMSQSKKVDVLPDKLKNKELVTCDERVFESAVTSLTTDKSDLPPVASVDIKTEPVGDDEELEENECKSEPVSDSAFDNSNVDSCDFQLETESDMGRLLSNSNLTPQFVEFNPVQGTSQEAASKNSHLVSQTSDSLVWNEADKSSEERKICKKGARRTETEEEKLCRLSERHFPVHVPLRDNFKRNSRRCAVCSKKKLRRESRYMCEQCGVGLCVVPCFAMYHTRPKL